MPSDMNLDVVVVGAGPAGSAAAAELARRGRSVLLLERSAFPRDKACGDGLTHAALGQLANLGLEPELAKFQSVGGTRLSFASGPQFTRATLNRRGQVVPRATLDALLSDQARAMGVVFAAHSRVTNLLRVDGRTVGVRYRTGAVISEVTSRFVVAADGATSSLARQAGLARPTDRTGFAVRAYISGLGELADQFQLFVPLVDPETGNTLPGYGWAFPVSADVANVGVGFLRLRPKDHEVNLRCVFRRFVESLGAGRALHIGRLRGAPLPCEFDPTRCAADGLVLVGDAARLVDPLSGEGIHMALESGALAAGLIDSSLSTGSADVPTYGAELQRRFGRRIGAAWSLVENHEFVWSVVSSTATIDSPLYRGVRRSVSSYDSDEPDPAPTPSPLRSWLSDHRLLDDVRTVQRRVREEAAADLPMLAAAVAELRDETAEEVRIACLLVCAGALTGAQWHRSAALGLAVASELGCLALSAHEDVLDALPHNGPRAANLFAVSAGDHLLARSNELAAAIGPWAIQLMSRATADICVGTLLKSLRNPVPTRAITLTTGTLFSLPIRLGSRLAQVDPAAATRLADVGLALGVTRHLDRQGVRARSKALDRACAGLAYSPTERALRTLIGVIQASG